MADDFAPAHSITIGQLLGNAPRFNFPFYQRTYVWSDEQILQLIGDIDLALDDMLAHRKAGRGIGATDNYFLGSLVIIHSDPPRQPGRPGQFRQESEPVRAYAEPVAPVPSLATKSFDNKSLGPVPASSKSGKTPVDVVDGQQRIITLSMLELALDLALQRGWFQTPDDPSAPAQEACPPELRQLLQQRFPNTDFRLSPANRNGAADRTSLSCDGDDEDNAVLRGWRAILRGLEGLGADRLADFHSYVQRRCWVVQIAAPTEADGHQIFINLNVRGRQLDDSEEYRAEILGHIASPTRRRELTQAWDGWRRRLGSAFDGRAGLFAQIAYLHTARPKSIALQIRKLYRARGGERFMDEIFLPCAQALAQLRAPNVRASLFHRSARAHERRVVQLIKLLNLLPNSDWVHVAMAWLLSNGNKIDDAESVAFFRALDRLAHLLLLRKIVGARSRRLFRPVIEALPAFTTPATPSQRRAARQILEDSAGRHYVLALKNSRQLYALGSDIARLVLYRLHLHSTAPCEPLTRQALKALSVEHVLPRGERLPRNSPWRTAFPNTQQRLKLADCSGNLALISRAQNSDAGHLAFADKQKLYHAAGPGFMKPIPWDEDFRSKEWREVHILARYQRIMRGIKELWDIPHTIPRYRP